MAMSTPFIAGHVSIEKPENFDSEELEKDLAEGEISDIEPLGQEEDDNNT